MYNASTVSNLLVGLFGYLDVYIMLASAAAIVYIHVCVLSVADTSIVHFIHSAGAVKYYANSYGDAPGETFRRRIYCRGSEASLSECSFSGNEQNCDPRYTLGVSCNTSKLKFAPRGVFNKF